ncbi:MAG: hypothetical protein QM504_13920 [Pseudomonadota bacterium]
MGKAKMRKRREVEKKIKIELECPEYHPKLAKSRQTKDVLCL